MTPGTVRSPRSAPTRDAILGGAAACFGRVGFAGASMDDIAAAAGVTKPTVYAHFGSKDGLFTELLQERLGGLDELPIEPAATADDVEALLRDYAHRRVDTLLADTSLGLLRAAAAEGIRRPEWATALMGSLGTSVFETWLEATTRAGFLDVESPAEAAELFWAQLEGALFFPVVVGMRAVPGRPERRRVIEASVRMFTTAHRSEAPPT
ncbi:MAG: TetR/AcrR family transcriptional regulator [Actinomycetota bacterium]